MKKLLFAGLVAVLLAVGAVVVNNDAAQTSVVDTTVPVVTPDIATITGDDVTDDDALGTQGEEDTPVLGAQPELEADLEVPDGPAIDRASVLSDVHAFIEARTEAMREAVVDIAEQRSNGREVGTDVDVLIDDLEVFGEAVVTAVAVTPEAIAAVPDLREIHQSLLDGTSDLHGAALQLDPLSSDQLWDASVADLLDALGALAPLIDLGS